MIEPEECVAAGLQDTGLSSYSERLRKDAIQRGSADACLNGAVPRCGYRVVLALGRTMLADHTIFCAHRLFLDEL